MGISVENRQFFSPPVYLTPPLTGFLLEFGIGYEVQKPRMTELPEWSKTFEDRFSRLDTIPAGVWQTAGQDQDHSVQDQNHDRLFWSQTGLVAQTGLVLRPMVSDHIILQAVVLVLVLYTVVLILVL